MVHNPACGTHRQCPAAGTSMCTKAQAKMEQPKITASNKQQPTTLSNSGAAPRYGLCYLATHISVVNDTLSSKAHLTGPAISRPVSTPACTTGLYRQAQDRPSAPNTLLPSPPVAANPCRTNQSTPGNLLLPHTASAHRYTAFACRLPLHVAAA